MTILTFSQTSASVCREPHRGAERQTARELSSEPRGMQATVMRAAISLSTSEKPSFHSLKLVPISMPTLRRAHDAFVALQTDQEFRI